MLTALALGMVGTFIGLLMIGRLSPLVALIVVPVVFGLIGGFGPELGPMMLDGVKQLAPTGVMLAFAIWYFSLMADAGLFDPAIRFIKRRVGEDPVRIVTGTAVLSLIVSLDGDGSTTYLIVCAALLPIYQRLRLDPLVLACLLMLACGITNVTPWGGPTAKVAAALKVDVAEVFIPLIPGLVAASFGVVGVGYLLGRRERDRLSRAYAEAPAWDPGPAPFLANDMDLPASQAARLRGWFNLALTATLVANLMLGALPLPILFMVATAIALIVNFPSPKAQAECLAAHAGNILRVIMVIFAAGVFVGIINGTGMAAALGNSLAEALPTTLGPYLGPLTGLLSVPFTFVMPNEGFFFGVLPILAETAELYDITPEELARAALVSQAVHLLSPVVPSTHLLVALVGVELRTHQRFTILWAIGVSLIILAVSLLIGAIPFTR